MRIRKLLRQDVRKIKSSYLAICYCIGLFLANLPGGTYVEK